MLYFLSDKVTPSDLLSHKSLEFQNELRKTIGIR
jgi:hypothetical protein